MTKLNKAIGELTVTVPITQRGIPDQQGQPRTLTVTQRTRRTAIPEEHAPKDGGR